MEIELFEAAIEDYKFWHKSVIALLKRKNNYSNTYLLFKYTIT